jgi:SAM-dependent methyltransferase
MSLLLCCLADKEGAIDEAWRILRPGGLVLVSYPRIGATPFRRKRSLAVAPERWDALRARCPWLVVSSRRGWFATRHVLRKP